MPKKLKRYRLKINPENGSMVDFISQVESPAIERGFLKFDTNKLYQKFEDDEKMELFGPVLIPDMPIYRRSEKLGEYEVYFTVEDIKQIQMNFMKNGFQGNMNLDHSDKMSDSYVFGFFQSNDYIPIANPEKFNDLPLGSLYAHVKVDNKDVWNKTKSGEYNGFSIEGIFEYMMDDFESQYLENHKKDTTLFIETQEKITLIEMFKNLFKKSTPEQKVFLEGIVEVFNEMDKAAGEEFNKVNSADYKISAREVGQKVEVIAQDQTLAPAEDGNYEFEDGFKFTVKDGMIESIDGQEAPKEDKPTEEVKAEDAPVEPNKELEDLKSTVAGLQSQIDEIKKAIEGVATEESMKAEMDKLSNAVTSVFQKFSKIPAEDSKVIKNNAIQDDKRKKFEDYVASLSSLKK